MTRKKNLGMVKQTTYKFNAKKKYIRNKNNNNKNK